MLSEVVQNVVICQLGRSHSRASSLLQAGKLGIPDHCKLLAVCESLRSSLQSKVDVQLLVVGDLG